MRIYRPNSSSNVKINIHRGDIDTNQATKNLMKIALRADFHDITWYKDAHEFAVSVAKDFNVSLDKVCQVISVLSPMQEWEKNKRATIKCLKSWKDKTFVACSFNYKHTQKAYDILDGQQQLTDSRHTRKTFRFYQNILNPLGKEYVCIDSHAVSVLFGLHHYSGSYKIDGNEYLIAENIYKKVAKLFNVSPNDFQAIVWEQIRREKTKSLLDFIRSNDSEISGKPCEILRKVAQ